MNKLLSIVLSICLCVGVFTAVMTDNPVFGSVNATIFVAGDSTAASYEASRHPLTGWAQMLDTLVPGNIQVRNYAQSGRSSKSFVDEGRLSAVLSEMNEGDYFFIQFGHNDQSADENRRTDPNTTFKEYLKKYIDEARAKKATPILVTPIERRRFSGGVLSPSLTPQADAMRQLAAEENVALIDANAEFARYLNALGQDGSKEIFLIVDKGESPNYPDGITDNTHLSEYGATQVAKIVLSELAGLGLPISADMKGIESPVPAAVAAQAKEDDEGSEGEDEGEDKEAPAEAVKGISAYDEAIEALYELGVVTGDENGALRADAKVTRAEFAALLTRIMPQGGTGQEQAFSDVGKGHWAWDSISMLLAKGIISGYGNGYFGPEDQVTFAQAVKMIIQALGFGDEAESIAAYPWGYLMKAGEIGVTRDVDGAADETVSRGMASKLLMNAIYIPTGDGEGILAQNLKKTIYYISQDGSDDNDGTYLMPWKTLKKAAASLEAGQVAVLNDGEYYEGETTLFKNSGTADAPIVVRARTKHGAKVIYPELLSTKISIPQGIGYITIKNLDITYEGNTVDDEEAEEEKPIREGGEFILCGGSNSSLAGNKLTVNAGTAIKLQKDENTLAEGNVISGGDVGIEAVNSAGAIIRGNEISGQSEACVQLRGGTRNARVYNNSIYDDAVATKAAIRFGGVSAAAEAYDTAKGEGFETYNCVAWNNIIASSLAGLIEAGIEYMGARDCHVYNSIITGAYTGVRFSETEGEENGWGWNPINLTPVLRNNIFTNCVYDTYEFGVRPQSFNANYNLFYNTYPEIKESGSKFTNPYFAGEFSDWHLMQGSPAIGTGAVIAPEFAGFGGEVLLLDLRDFEGTERIGSWNMGIYNTISDISRPTDEPERLVSGAALLAEDFTKPLTGWTVSSVGKWESQGGVCAQTDGAVARTTLCYDNGLTWTDYEFSVDIKSPNSTVDNVTGVIFRSDAKMENMYAFRMYANNQLEFAKWQNNAFNSIEKWDFNFTPDTFYNLKISAKGNKIAVYINNKQVKTFEDDTFTTGTIGLYTFKQTGAFDNVRVNSLR